MTNGNFPKFYDVWQPWKSGPGCVEALETTQKIKMLIRSYTPRKIFGIFTHIFKNFTFKQTSKTYVPKCWLEFLTIKYGTLLQFRGIYSRECIFFKKQKNKRGVRQESEAFIHIIFIFASFSPSRFQKWNHGSHFHFWD